MWFQRTSPESAGVHSQNVLSFLRYLQECDLAMHSVLMMRGNSLFAECYWAPFTENTCHRMYSQTKSYTSVAIGLLEEEGKLSLDDPIVSYFPEKLEGVPHPYFARQTIRNMLTMTTVGSSPYWFTAGDPDRTHLYMNHCGNGRAPGTIWEYDSAGSQVLASLVEKLAGMPLLEYLRKKLFHAMGTFRTATILQTPNGDSWGDSALVCTPRDMLSFGRFVMNYGTWNGVRLMNEAYLRAATSRQVDNMSSNFRHAFEYGYGYQIWRTQQNGFAFVGMGEQLTICLPERDFIFVCTADNQGNEAARDLLVRALFERIVDPMQENALPPEPRAEAELASFADRLTLRAADGEVDSPFRAELEGKTYLCEPNGTGITRFSFHFTEDGGELHYCNAQGEKTLPFGMGRNVFGKFPQFGYANERGGVATGDGFLYDAAVSAAWTEEKKLRLCVQIIDRYLGNASFVFAFRENLAYVSMRKTAEDFLEEYHGAFMAQQLET